MFRHIYYDYATSYLADQAGAELKKIPETDLLPPPTFADHGKRAAQLYKGRHYNEAVSEYKAMVDTAPANLRSDVLIKYANSLIKTGQNREAACGA